MAGDSALSRRRHRGLLTCLMLALLMVAFNQTILTTALPTIAGELDGAESVAWVIAGFVLASTITIPVCGSLSDRRGRRGFFLAAAALFTLASIAAALAPTIEVLIACRLVQGVGGGGLLVLPQAILADAVPVRLRPRYAGLFGTVWAVASLAGPLLGGWFAEGPGWQWSFWINVPLGVIVIVLTLVFVRPAVARPEPTRPDYVGILLLAAATGAATLVAGGVQVGTDGTLSAVVLVAVAAAASAAFLVVQARVRQPTFSLSILRDRDFLLATAAGLLTGGVAMFAVITYLPVYLQMVRGMSPANAGLAMFPMIGTLLLVSSVVGFRVSRTGRYKAVTITGCLVSAAGLTLMSTLGDRSPLWVIFAAAAMFGAGLGTIVQLLLVVVQASAPRAEVGAATAANTYFRQVGAVLGIAGVGTVFATRLTTELSGRADELGLDPGSLTPALLALLGPDQRSSVVDAYGAALPPLFLALVPLVLASAVLLAFLRNRLLPAGEVI